MGFQLMLIQMHVDIHTHTYRSSVLVCGGVKHNTGCDGPALFFFFFFADHNLYMSFQISALIWLALLKGTVKLHASARVIPVASPSKPIKGRVSILMNTEKQ